MSVYGRTMLLFREGRIMVSEKGTHGWKEPQPIGRALTIGSWQADAMLTRDGQAMLFAAYERGDNGGRPSINIYVAHRDSTGRWQKPISLGPTINTEATERALPASRRTYALFLLRQRVHWADWMYGAPRVSRKIAGPNGPNPRTWDRRSIQRSRNAGTRFRTTASWHSLP